MPVTGIEDFKEQYYNIINQIALTPENERDASKKEDWQTSLTNLQNDAKALKIEEFQLELNNEDFAEKSHLNQLSKFYADIREGAEDIEKIDDLNIPEINKSEIKAQGFVLAFDGMRDSKNDGQFMKHYANVQKMSKGKSVPEQVENLELNTQLEYTKGILYSFENDDKYKERITVDSLNQVIEDKQKLLDEQKSPTLKIDEKYSSAKLTESSYLYEDKDIDAVLSQRLSQIGDKNIYQMDAVALGSGDQEKTTNELTTKRIATRISNIADPKTGKKLLIPLNVGNNH